MMEVRLCSDLVALADAEILQREFWTLFSLKALLCFCHLVQAYENFCDT